MDVLIRAATDTDAAFISGLCDQLGYECLPAETEKRLQYVLQDTHSCIFVAVVNEKLVGWIHGFYTVRVESDPFTEIGGLVVDKDYRRKNIGKLLVDKIVEWAHIREYKQVRVRCNALRTESHQFYLSLGFVETKQQKIFSLQFS